MKQKNFIKQNKNTAIGISYIFAISYKKYITRNGKKKSYNEMSIFSTVQEIVKRIVYKETLFCLYDGILFLCITSIFFLRNFVRQFVTEELCYCHWVVLSTLKVLFTPLKTAIYSVYSTKDVVIWLGLGKSVLC